MSGRYRKRRDDIENVGTISKTSGRYRKRRASPDAEVWRRFAASFRSLSEVEALGEVEARHAYLRGMNRIRISAFAALAALSGCMGTKSPESANEWTPPAAGVLVAADSVRITGDSLNQGYFAVYLRVAGGNSSNAAFVYDLEAHYGKADVQGTITMPYGGERLKPLLRVEDERNMVMGFIPGALGGGDTSFHAYYRVSGSNVSVHLTPLAAYKIQ